MANTSHARQQASYELTTRKVDPLLPRTAASASLHAPLTDEEERLAIVYLKLALSERDSEKSLTKFCHEAFLLYVLRESTAEHRMKRVEIHKAVKRFLASERPATFRSRIDGALQRLRTQKKLTHHTIDDSFSLAHGFREEIEKTFEESSLDITAVRKEIRDRVSLVAERLGVDFEYPLEDVVSDVICLADRYLFERGRAAAEAFRQQDFFETNNLSLDDFATKLILQHKVHFASRKLLGVERFLDIVPPTVEDILLRPSEMLLRRLSATIDAYCLAIAAREVPDLQKAINVVVTDNNFPVDASVVVRCMAEEAFPETQRPLSSLLRSAHSLGVRMVIHDDAIEEIHSHLKVVRLRYAQVQSRIPGHDGEILDAFLANQRQLGSFSSFMERFEGDNQPKEDIKDYLSAQLNIEHSDVLDGYDAIDAGELEQLIIRWKQDRHGKGWRDDEAVERLVRHDARALLAIEALRSKHIRREMHYGHRWWYLTLDHNAYRIDRVRRKQQKRGISVCMSPDFFSRYLSIIPKPRDVEMTIPLSVEVACLGLIPKELTERAREAMAEMGSVPEYLRRRKLRDLANAAKAGTSS